MQTTITLDFEAIGPEQAVKDAAAWLLTQQPEPCNVGYAQMTSVPNETPRARLVVTQKVTDLGAAQELISQIQQAIGQRQ